MKTFAESNYYARKFALGVLRHLPKTRLLARKAYWGLQQKRYERLTAAYEVDEKLVFFESFFGRWCADSPKAIYNAMLRDERFADYVFIWSFKPELSIDELEIDADRTVIVQRGRDEYFQALAMAKHIVLNTRLPEFIYPRAEQVFVQCWHGTPLKCLGADVSIETSNALNTSSELAWRFAIDSQKWTYLLSASPYVTGHLSSAFSLPQEKIRDVVLEVGDPGNDVLAQSKTHTSFAVAAREKLGIPEGKKVLLYAPTWRDDSYVPGVGYTLDYLLDFDLLQAQLGKDWVVLFRPHYYIGNQFDFSKYPDFVLDASKVGDINDCMLASDVLLTDYSSVMFDYCNTGKPIMLYVPDLRHYSASIRDFYFDIHDVPGPLCMTTEELLSAMNQLDGYHDMYGTDYEAFTARFCPKDDGRATARVLDALFTC